MFKDEWKLIYEQFYKPLYLYALSLTGNQQDAEDLLQETFVKAYLSYENKGSIKYWLIVVLKNEYLQLQRKRKREILHNETNAPINQKVELSTEGDILTGIIEHEERKQLFKEILSLPLNMKEILIENVYFQMSDTDIAKLHNMTNENVRKIVFRTVTVMLIIILVAVFGINPLMNSMYFNPYEMNEGKEQKMLGVMRDYVETALPYREVVRLEVEEKGFGRYEIAMQMVDLSNPPVNIGKENVWVEMNRGEYGDIKDADSLMNILMGRFSCDWTDQEDFVKRIKALPESAMIYLSVSDAEIKSLEQLRDLPVGLHWLQVYQPNVEFQGGLLDAPIVLYSDDDDRIYMTEQELLEVYRRNLENLLENPEVWERLFGLSSDDGKIFGEPKLVLEETYEDATKLTALMSKNYCVYGSRDEILTFLQENELNSIDVENTMLW